MSSFLRGNVLARVVVRTRSLRRLVQAFQVMGVFYVSHNELASSLDITLGVSLLFPRLGKALANADGSFVGHQLDPGFSRAVLQSLVGLAQELPEPDPQLWGIASR